MSAAGRIIHHVFYNVESVLCEAGLIVLGRKAGMIHRFAADLSDDVACGVATGEHQRGTRGGMGGKGRKHRALIVL